jgi:hypothetical protein
MKKKHVVCLVGLVFDDNNYNDLPFVDGMRN